MAKDKIIDITKTGPLNFRDLQQLNAQGEEQYLPENSLDLFASNWGESKEFSSLLSDWGESMFDDASANAIELENLQDIRAENLPGILKLGAGFGKMITTAGTTFLDGTLGSLWGVGQGIANLVDEDEETGFWQGMWDNDFNKAMASINELMEKALPNYYTKEEQESPWYSLLGTMNFWADGFLKNAGFMIGAAAAAMVTGGINTAIGNTLGATKLGNKLAGVGKFADWAARTFTSANGEAAIEAINTVNEKDKEGDFNLLQRRNLKYAELNDQSLALAKLALIETQLAILLGMNPEEAYKQYTYKIEAIKNSELLGRQLIDSDLERVKQELQSMLRDAGNSVYALNMALLATTNNINMASFIKGGYNNAELLNNIVYKVGDKEVKRGTKEFSKGLLEGTLEATADEISHGTAKTAARWGINAASEAFLEGAQSVISEGSALKMQANLNKFTRENTILGAQLNPDVSEELTDTMKSFYEAYSRLFGTIESPGWKEAFLGALTGGVGMVSLKKTNEGYRPTWIGGWKEAHTDIYEDRDKLLAMLELVNSKLQDPKTKENIQHAVSKMALKKEADQALLNGDIRQFKNNEVASLALDAMFYKNMGMLDDYMRIYDSYAEGLSDKDLEELYAQTYNEELKKSPLTEERKEEIRKRYQEKAISTKNKILNILDNYETITNNYGNKFSDKNRGLAIMELTLRLSLLDDTYRRIEELTQLFKDIQDDSDIKKQEKRRIKSAIDSLTKLASYLRDSISKAVNSPKSFEDDLDKIRLLLEKYKLGKDAEKVLEKYKEAKTLREVDDVYRYADPLTREKVLNEAIEKASEDTKVLLSKYKDFIEDILIIDKAIYESIPEGVREDIANYLIQERLLELSGIINEIIDSDSDSYVESLSEKLKQLSERYINLSKNSSDESSKALNAIIANDYASFHKKLLEAETTRKSGQPKKPKVEATKGVSEEYSVTGTSETSVAPWDDEESSKEEPTKSEPKKESQLKPASLTKDSNIITVNLGTQEGIKGFENLELNYVSKEYAKLRAQEKNPIVTKELREKLEKLRTEYNNTYDSEILRNIISLAKELILPEPYYKEIVNWIKGELEIERKQGREGTLAKWYNNTYSKTPSKEELTGSIKPLLELSSKVSLDNFDDNFYITVFYNGLSSMNTIKPWSEKAHDVRNENTGWHEENGLIYFIRKHSTNEDTNITIWFKNKPNEQLKKNVEEWVTNHSENFSKQEFINYFNKTESSKADQKEEKEFTFTEKTLNEFFKFLDNELEKHPGGRASTLNREKFEKEIKSLNIEESDSLDNINNKIEEVFKNNGIVHYFYNWSSYMNDSIVEALLLDQSRYEKKLKTNELLTTSASQLGNSITSTSHTNFDEDQLQIEQSNDSFRGNTFNKYDRGSLESEDKRLVIRDLYDQERWLNDLGYKIQEFIDNELHKVPLDTPVRYIHKKDVNNIVLLGMKYSDVKEYINSNNATIIDTNDGDYVLIGTLGYPPNLKDTLGKQFKVINDTLISESADLSSNYTVSTFENRIKDMTDGYLAVSSLFQDKKIKDLAILFNSSSTNPKGLSINDMQWAVVEGTPEIPTIKDIKATSDGIHFKAQSLYPGKVFMYIPTAKGNYIPSYILAVSWNDIQSNDSLYFLDLNTIIKTLLDKNSSVEAKKKAISNLRGDSNHKGILIFPENSNIFYNEKGPNQNEGLTIKVVNLYDRSINFEDKEYSLETAAELIYSVLKEVNPKINIKTEILSSNPLYYLDAGLLRTELVGLLTYNSLVYLYPINGEGKYIVNLKPNLGLNKALIETKDEFYLDGSLYKSNGTLFYDSNGNVIKDEILLTDLKDVEGIKHNVYKALELKKVTYWETPNGVYTKDRGAGYRKLTTELKELYNKDKVKLSSENSLDQTAKEQLTSVNFSATLPVEELDIDNFDTNSLDEDNLPEIPIESTDKSFTNSEETTGLISLKDLVTSNNSINFDTLLSIESNEDDLADALEEKGYSVDTISELKDGVSKLGLSTTNIKSQDDFNNLIENIKNCK